MEEAEVRKTCRSCGEDLRHKKRHKNRDGTYLCPKCAEAENRWGRRVITRLTDKKLRLLVLYIILAVVAGIVFWQILDVMSHVDWTSL
jgi:hypothetical protein